MTMDYYAGLDVALESASVCLVGEAERIVRETRPRRRRRSRIVLRGYSSRNHSLRGVF
jgi:hypothetical protein